MTSEPVMRIGFFSDTHLDYRANCRFHVATGLNERVRDGFYAMRYTIDQMIEADVDMVLHGGDLFHWSHPSVAAVVWARQQLDRLVRRGIPVIGNTGNHDATSVRGKLSATEAVHDPDRGIEMVTEPYRILRPADGLAIHMLSHFGLAQEQRLLPEPIDGAVNILSAHGAAMLPGHEVFRCTESPNEQPIGLDLLLDDRFAIKALGHYHGMGEIMPGSLYAGSAIRRGFSDPAGGRGWVLLNVYSDGRVVPEWKYIPQRPQFDLPVIDASGLTGAQVEEMIRANLDTIEVGNAIIRQVVTNCTTSVGRGIDHAALQRLTASALMWMPAYNRPEFADPNQERVVDGASASLLTAGRTNLPQMFGGWVREWGTEMGLAEELMPVVAAEGDRHLRAVSEGFDSAFAAPAETTPAETGSGIPVAVPAMSDAETEPALVGSTQTVDNQTGEVAPW